MNVEAASIPELSREDRILYAFEKNVVVAASAGTGKTHRLTSLWVLAVLGLTSMGQRDERTPAPPLAPQRIVATTFSRAAAQEMWRRVQRALDVLASGTWPDGDPVVGVVRARQAIVGGAVSDAEIVARARDAARRLPSARIDTLHGLAATIVRAHAERLRASPDVRVLDEDEARELADAAIDRTLSLALAGSLEEASAARHLIAACGNLPAARAAVVRLLDRLDDEGLGVRDLETSDAEAEALAVWNELLGAARACAASATEAIRGPAARLAVELGHAAPGTLPAEAVPHLLDLAAQRVPSAPRRTEGEARLADLLDGLGTDSKAERARRLAAFLATGPELAGRERAVLALLERLRAALWNARASAGAVSFSDLLRIARDALAEDVELCAEVRAGVDVLLVDEFQDTSRVQRDLVYLLMGEKGAGRGVPAAHELRRSGLFLVGDRKQSIYGFRGADVSVFVRTCVELCGAPAAGALGIRLDEPAAGQPRADFVALRESRRAGPNVLAFVNAFSERDFAREAGHGDYEVRYGEAEHLTSALAPSTERRDEVVLVRDDGKVPEGADPLVATAAGPLREALVAAAFVAAEIPASGGALAWRDVAVLARRRSTIPLVELALGRLDVPYVVAGRALYDALEVRDVASLLRLVVDPRDKLALAAVLRGPMVGLSDAALAALSLPKNGLVSPWTRPGKKKKASSPEKRDEREERLGPVDRARLADFRTRWAELRRTALRLAPADAVRVAVETFDYDRVLAALPRAQARLGNVDRLVEIARRRGGTLASFVRWLDERIADESDEAEAAVFSPDEDAVRLLTIHASKGLDFPVVVLLDLDASSHPDPPGIAHREVVEGGQRRAALVMRHLGAVPRADGDEGPLELAPITTPSLREARNEARARDRAERKRLTYVALTRARQILAIVVPSTRPRSNSAHATLAAGLADPELCALVGRDENATALLARAERRRLGLAENGGEPLSRAGDAVASASKGAPAPLASDHAVRPDAPRCVRLPIATTPLGVFASCPRRFRLRYLVGLEEPVASGQLTLFDLPPEQPGDERPEDDASDPRALGRAAHRVLERWPIERWGDATRPAEVAAALAREGLVVGDAETDRIAEDVARFLGGSYARSVREDGCAVSRELSFVVGAGGTGGLPRVDLRGTIDLLVVRPDGTTDVVDYKRSRPRSDLSAYAFQLQAYALAARRRLGATRVRAGILFLGASEPVMLAGSGPGGTLDDERLAAFEREIATLGARLAEARWRDEWSGVELETCQRLRCGFVPACHGPGR